MTDDEFEAQRSDIEAQLRQAEAVIRPSHHEAAAIFGGLPQLWMRATTDERRRIAGLLLDRVYVDLEVKLIPAIVPTAEFGLLLQHALENADRADVLLVPLEHVDALDALHAPAIRWRLGPQQTTRETPTRMSRPPSSGMLEMVETGES